VDLIAYWKSIFDITSSFIDKSENFDIYIFLKAQEKSEYKFLEAYFFN